MEPEIERVSEKIKCRICITIPTTPPLLSIHQLSVYYPTPPKYIPTVRKPSLLIQNQNQIKRKKMFKQKNTKKRQKPQTGTWASRLCALCQTPPSPRLPSSLAPPIVFFSFHRLFRSLGKVTRFGYVQDGGV